MAVYVGIRNAGVSSEPISVSSLWDERRTTVAAHEILHRSGKKEKKHRQSVDAVAATLILQGYLDFKRRQ